MRTRDLIINLFLEKTQGISAKKLHSILKNEHSKSLTYQAIYKILRELEEENIISKNNFEYSINLEYLKNQKEKISKAIQKIKGSEPYKKLFSSKDLEIYEFYNLQDMHNYYNSTILKFTKKSNKKEIFWKSPHCWWIIAYPIDIIKKTILAKNKNIQTFGLITRNFEQDKKDLIYYRKKYENCHQIKEKLNDNEFVQVFEDKILISNLPKKFLNKLNKYYMKKDLENNKIVELILEKQKFELKIIKNKTLAETYKKQISGED